MKYGAGWSRVTLNHKCCEWIDPFLDKRLVVMKFMEEVVKHGDGWVAFACCGSSVVQIRVPLF